MILESSFRIVLLLDEVLAVGDLAFQQKCFQRIAELKERGTTMIFISHNLEAVQKLCDRVVLLQQGQVMGEGEPAEMMRRYREDVLASMRQSDATARPHDAAVTIQDVVLRDAHGASVASCATGQPLRIEIHYQTQRPLRRPAFRVSIERLDGLLCHATTTDQDALPAAAVTGAGLVTLEYPAMNLLPNLYHVAVEICEGEETLPVAAAHQRCYFHITADHHEQGAVHLEHTWSLDRGDAATPTR